MDAILGHDSEEVLREAAWEQSSSDAMRSMVTVVTFDIHRPVIMTMSCS